MKIKKQLKAISFFILLGIAIFVLYKSFKALGETNFKTKSSSINQQTPFPETIFKNFQLKQIGQNSRETWLLFAKEGKLFHTTGQVECNDIECNLMSDNKKIATLNSIKGFVDQNQKNVFLKGPAFGHFNEMQFEGKDINYNFSNHKLYSNSKTTYKHPLFEFCANKSWADFKKNKIEMTGNIQCKLFLK